MYPILMYLRWDTLLYFVIQIDKVANIGKSLNQKNLWREGIMSEKKSYIIFIMSVLLYVTYIQAIKNNYNSNE